MTGRRRRSARTLVPGSTYPAPHADAIRIGPCDPAAGLDLTVVLRPRLGFDQPATGAAGYRAEDGAIGRIAAFATSHGLVVGTADAACRTMELSGTVARIELAFGVSLVDYRIGTAPFRIQQGAIHLPTALAGLVVAVLGLDDRPLLRTHASAVAVRAQQRYPREVAALYRFPAGDGAGTTIAVLEFGGDYSDDDLATYFAAAGTPMPQVVRYPVCGFAGEPYDSGSASMEVMLDLELIGNIVPAAKLDVYFAPNSGRGLYAALSQAVHEPATTAVSISWGHVEERFSQQLMTAVELLAQQAARLGVVIFAACGDAGVGGEWGASAGRRQVVFPASAPAIVACGGTTLHGDDTISSETVWNDHAGATGGGLSSFFGLPDRQRGLSAEAGVPLAMRGVPDVAGDAAPDTGYRIRWAGSDGYVAGTSAVAPLWAALAARIAQHPGARLGSLLPLLYGNPSVCNDIVAGNNSWASVPGFQAKPGWDACTGLGSPDGGRILELLTSAAAPGTAPSEQSSERSSI